jgi:hypothetical protein
VHVEHLVVRHGLVALLLRGVVWNRPQRIKRRAARIIPWHEQQQTGACVGLVISVKVHPQPAQEHLHLLSIRLVRTDPTCSVEVAEPELSAGWADYHGTAQHAHRAAHLDADNVPLEDMKVR